MGRMVNTDHLVSLSHAAKKLGIPKRRLERWVERRAEVGFPHPVYSDRSEGKGFVVVYDYLQIWAWHRDWKLQHRVNGSRKAKK